MVGEENTLEVRGAILFYKVRGTGPVLLIIQGGAGDADGSDRLADGLVDAYRVVTYDRRGLSRSTLTDETNHPTLETHSEDAHHLLAMVTTEPALVFGASLGAVIALDLTARYPDQVHTLVAHEPASPELLSEAERNGALLTHARVEETFHREGVAAAMVKMLAVAGTGFHDREPDLELPKRDDQAMARMASNMTFFLTYDAGAAHRFKPDIAALRRAPTRIVPAAGQTSGDTWPRHSAMALAAQLGTDLEEFPGNHSGPMFRPRAFSKRLRAVFEETDSSD
jgi:pimeloyl-ACP methyl ester carboxylesterase